MNRKRKKKYNYFHVLAEIKSNPSYFYKGYDKLKKWFEKGVKQ